MEQFGVEGTIEFSHENLTEEEKESLLTYVSNIAYSNDDLYTVQTQHKDHTIVEIDSTNTAEDVHAALRNVNNYISNIIVLHINMFYFADDGVARRYYYLQDGEILMDVEEKRRGVAF